MESAAGLVSDLEVLRLEGIVLGLVKTLVVPWSSVTWHIVGPTGLVSSLDQLVQQ